MSGSIWELGAEKLDDGRHFLYYAGDPESFPGLRLLKIHLFAWHEASYYGTMIEEWSWAGKHGFVLPARQAVGFWNALPVLKYGNRIEWNGETENLRQSAALVKRALTEGWFVPALTQRKDGVSSPGWRMLRLEDAHPNPEFAKRCEQLGWEKLDRQLADTLRDLATSPGQQVFESFQQVKAAHPAAAVLERPDSACSFADEFELWETIGFRTDSLPFAVGLRLEEPLTQDGEWRLVPWVYDRSAPGLGFAVDWSGTPAGPGAVVPQEWPAGAIKGAVERQKSRWSTWIPNLEEPMGGDQVWEFLELGGEKLAARGVLVLLPAWWEELRKAKPAAVAKLRPGAGASGLLGKDQLLDFDWMVSIGDSDLDIGTFREAVQKNRRIIRHEDRWIVLHPKWVQAFQQFFKRMGKREQLTLSEVVEMYLSGGRDIRLTDGKEETPEIAGTDAERESEMSWQVRLNAPVAEWLARLEDKNWRDNDSWLPENLKAVLRGYQKVGTSWLLTMRQIGFGACLADDMGLGKTLQFISYLAALKEREELAAPGLLICPTSVLGNWQKELEWFAPQLRVYLHYGPKREQGESFVQSISGCDLVVTSYALANSDAEFLRRQVWSVIGLDEAQNIKNPHGKQSLAVRSLNAGHRVALTGTPVENRLAELWTIFDFINPAYLGSHASFQKRFGWLDKPASDGRDSVRRQERTQQLQRIIRPFLLRRVKSDPAIQLDLPDKIENLVYIPLTVEQGALYEAELQTMLDKIERLDPMERRGLILATLSKLKQICDHPALYLKETGGVSSRISEEVRSHKLSRLLEMTGEALEEGRKGIIFTQFVGMGHLLREALERAHGCRVDFLHGETTKAERDRCVQRFQGYGNEQSDFLVLSIKAGGTGLNLTAASHVFHYDRWWNPAVEEQATDRAHRIGQTRNVQVHKFVALGTVEEKIDEMILRKKTLSAQIVGSGEQWITELSTDELKEMFALRREWVRD